MITEVYLDVQKPLGGKHVNLVNLTNLFETLYPRLITDKFAEYI